MEGGLTLLGNQMRRREKANRRADDGEGAENDETEAINDNGGKLPLADDVVEVVFSAKAVGDEAKLRHDVLEEGS